MSQYAFHSPEHGTFTPDGHVDLRPYQVDAYNREQTERELAALQEPACTRAMLYVTLDKGAVPSCGTYGRIHTWTGHELDARAHFSARRYIGFGYHTYRRAVTCTLFGVAWHGWFMESSGDYCRLTRSKAKGQEGKKVSK
jgi:hypothetical protein